VTEFVEKVDRDGTRAAETGVESLEVSDIVFDEVGANLFNSDGSAGATD